MFVIEVVGRATRGRYGYVAGEIGGKNNIKETMTEARKFALPADAIPYAEDGNGKHSALEFNVVPYVES